MIHGTSKKISFHNSGKSEDIRCRNGVFGSTMDVTVDVYLSLLELPLNYGGRYLMFWVT